MQSIRGRLTLWYTVALAVTVLAFGGVLYGERRQSSFAELDQVLALEAGLSRRWLAESQRVLGEESLVTRGEAGAPALDPSIAAYFEGIRDALLVLDPEGRVLFASEAARALKFEGIERLAALARPLPGEVVAGTVALGAAPAWRYRLVPLRGVEPAIAALVVAKPVTDVVFGPEALLRSMVLSAPLILVCALGLGYLIAGRALAPVQGLADELDAISDGRSLHRRLAVPLAEDEITRLAQRLNGMLARLERSFGTLRRFTADASHELKTPLMVLRAGVERALTDPRTPAETLAGLDEALEQINRMSEMVESLLTLARADEGGDPLSLEPVDLRALVEEAAETAEMLGEPAGVAVGAELPPQPVVIDGDRGRLRQLLLNLVTNAIKYTPAGGRVSLALEAREQGAVLVVRDTGIGISPGDVERVFDRFWRADVARSRTGDRAGTGLGLAICKWIAEAHGGAITVASRPGKGSAFSVTLPWPAVTPAP